MENIRTAAKQASEQFHRSIAPGGVDGYYYGFLAGVRWGLTRAVELIEETSGASPNILKVDYQLKDMKELRKRCQDLWTSKIRVLLHEIINS